MEHNHRPFDEKLLTARLTGQNYREKFHQLLCREEEEHDRLLKERFVLCMYIEYYYYFKFIQV